MSKRNFAKFFPKPTARPWGEPIHTSENRRKNWPLLGLLTVYCFGCGFFALYYVVTKREKLDLHAYSKGGRMRGDGTGARPSLLPRERMLSKKEQKDLEDWREGRGIWYYTPKERRELGLAHE